MNLGKTTEKKEEKGEELKQTFNLVLARYFIWVIVFFCLLVLIGGYLFFLKPKYDYISNLAVENKTNQEEEYLSREQTLEKIKSLLGSYRKVDAASIKKVNHILPAQYTKEEIFTQIESIVKRNGLILASINLEAEEQDKNSLIDWVKNNETDTSLPAEVKRIKVSIDVVGTDYSSLKTLLGALENNLMLVDIVNLEFQPKGDSTSIIFDTYYSKS